MKRLAPFALALAVACDEQPPAWRLDRARVLGAIVSVQGDEPRASFAAGETLQIELVTASNAKARGAFDGYAFTACATDGNLSIAQCTGPRILALSGQGATDPVVTLTVPKDATGKLLVFGMLCEGGAARLDDRALLGACDGTHGQEVAIRLDVGGAPNRNPSFSADAVRFDGVTLPADGSCEATPWLVRGEGEHTLTIPSSQLGIESDDRPLLSHVATAGKLDRLYTLVDEKGDLVVKWTSPPAGAARTTARIHFVVRDGRGGVAFTTRSVCLEKGT